jgi:hypothetical protein
MYSRRGNACIAFHVTVVGVRLVKQADPWKYTWRSTRIIWGRVYWKNQNWSNICMMKATKYNGTKPVSYKLNLTSCTGNTRNWLVCLCAATSLVNTVWTYLLSGFLSSVRSWKVPTQFSLTSISIIGEGIGKLWQVCLNFTLLILIYYSHSNLC